MKQRLGLGILLAGVIAVLLPATIFAQSTAEIRGTVQDQSGGVVPGATVTAINELTGLERTTLSDSGGRFNLPRLPVGNYRVEVKVDGFRPFATAPFRLNVEDIRQVNAVMVIGALEEGVTVTGQAAVVETVGGTLSEIVDERRIQELPLNGRDPLQLQLLLPGVVTGPTSTAMWQQPGISVNGLRGISNNYMLDSGDNNDVLGGTAAIVPNPDALEEFTVQTSNFSAEYGRNMGAVINAVTKSGTNRLRGTAYDFMRNDSMDAKQFLRSQKGMLRRSQYGGTLGGPISRDRMFFFAAFEGLEIAAGREPIEPDRPDAARKKRRLLAVGHQAERSADRAAVSEQSDSTRADRSGHHQVHGRVDPAPECIGRTAHLQRADHQGWLAGDGTSRHAAHRPAAPVWPDVLRQERAGQHQWPARSCIPRWPTSPGTRR